jgi:hypothetical protein
VNWVVLANGWLIMLDDALKEKEDLLQGVSATDRDIRQLRAYFSNVLIPDWLESLLKNHRLAGACFSLDSGQDRSGLGAELLWLSPKQMISEAFDAEPGKSVVSSGFLAIGSCALGSGDPYFLDLREFSNDPPVVRIPHDYAGPNSYPLERVEIVVSHLSELFHDASL